MSEKKKPSMLTMMKNFAKDSAEFIKQGAPMCSTEEYEARMEICRSCEHLTEDDKCGICGCFMPVKAGWKTTECADTPKKWKKLIGDDVGQESMQNFINNTEANIPKASENMLISDQSKKREAEARRAHLNKLKGKVGGHNQK